MSRRPGADPALQALTQPAEVDVTHVKPGEPDEPRRVTTQIAAQGGAHRALPQVSGQVLTLDERGGG